MTTMTPVLFEADKQQAERFGCLLRVFCCHVKPSDEQCVHMLVLEWLDEAFKAMREWFEHEAAYSDRHQLEIGSLKQFGQFSAAITAAQKYVQRDEAACGRCRECRSGMRAHANYMDSDPHETLTYYEQYHRPRQVADERKRRGGPAAAGTPAAGTARHWSEGAD